MGVLSGKAWWASVHNPNTTYEPVWTIDVCCLDEKNKKIAEEDGLNIQNRGDERGDYVQFKRKVTRTDGRENTPPIIVDAQKNTIDPSILIGNGSTVNVLYKPYEWTYKNRSGVGADLRKVQVVDLVPYEADDGELEVIPDGYSVTGKAAEDLKKEDNEDFNDDIPFGV